MEFLKLETEKMVDKKIYELDNILLLIYFHNHKFSNK